jgi:hypothetical protein
MQLQGPSLGCSGCLRPTAQPGTNGVSLAGSLRGARGSLAGLKGAASSVFLASPLTMLMGFGFGAFLAWNYAMKPKSAGVSGHRRRRR